MPSFGESYPCDDGWVLVNCHGVLALVLEDGSIIEPVYDEDCEEWTLPAEVGAS
jgi:hypothetical protein